MLQSRISHIMTDQHLTKVTGGGENCRNNLKTTWRSVTVVRTELNTFLERRDPFLGILSDTGYFFPMGVGKGEDICLYWVWAKDLAWFKKRKYSAGKRN